MPTAAERKNSEKEKRKINAHCRSTPRRATKSLVLLMLTTVLSRET